MQRCKDFIQRGHLQHSMYVNWAHCDHGLLSVRSCNIQPIPVYNSLKYYARRKRLCVLLYTRQSFSASVQNRKHVTIVADFICKNKIADVVPSTDVCFLEFKIIPVAEDAGQRMLRTVTGDAARALCVPSKPVEPKHDTGAMLAAQIRALY